MCVWECVCVCVHVLCALYLCHPRHLPLLHLTNSSAMLSLEAKKWQPVNCVPILTPPSASACPSPSLWCCLDQSSTLAKITKESEMEYTMLLADRRAMASHSAKLCLFLPFVSPPSVRLIISFSLGGTWGAGWAWFSLWSQAGSRCLGCLWSGFYDCCKEKHTFLGLFWGGMQIEWLAAGLLHEVTLLASTGLQHLWVQLAKSLTIPV